MEKFVLQWKETFPVNVPQLVSTEQTPSKKENVNSLYFETVCQEQFFFFFKSCMFLQIPASAELVNILHLLSSYFIK